MYLVVIGSASPQLSLYIKKRCIEVRACVRNQFGLGWVKDNDFVFKLRKELGRPAAYQFRHTIAGEKMAAVTRRVNAAHKPLFVSNHNTSAGGVREHFIP